MTGTAEEHSRVMTWAHGLTVQVDRLHGDRLAFMESHRRVMERAFYGHEDAKAPRLMSVDSHYVLVGAAQLVRALEAFDGDLRLPPELTRKHVRLLRNALEHWEGGWAVEVMTKMNADPASNRWREDGSGMLGDIVDDSAIKAWARAVYEALVDYDPPSPEILIAHP